MKKIIFREHEIFIEHKIGSRFMKLKFNKNKKLILSLPIFVSEKKGMDFLERNWGWVEKHNQEHPSYRFKNNMEVSILDKVYLIVHLAEAKRGVWKEDSFIYVSGDERYLNRRVCDFLKKEAKRLFEEHAFQLAAKIECRPSNVYIKDTFSRWGSCSSSGNLNFSWRLILAPFFVFDYIVAHEVAHLKEMNHSSDFWSLVAFLTTHQSEAHIWLRKYGKNLHALEYP